MTFPWSEGAHGPFQDPGGDAVGQDIRAYRNIYFVDNINGSDGSVGLSINTAFSTVQKALDTVQDEDTIIVFKGTGNYDEKLATGQNIRYAAMTAGRGRNVTLAGATPTFLPYNSPQLYNVSGSEYSLFVRSPGWRVTGFRIIGDTGAPRGLLAEMAQAANTADTNWAPGLQVDHCTFYGYVDTSNGGLLISALGDLKLYDCLFGGFGSTTLAALGSETGSLVTSAFTFPQAQIRRTNFSDCKLGIKVPFSAAVIMNSIFCVQNGTNSVATAGGIDLTGGGGNNLITDNFLGETYSTGGQYKQAAATDDWVGNTSPESGTGITANRTDGLPNQ